MMTLFLVAGLALVWLFRLKTGKDSKAGKRSVVPEAVGVLVMSAQISELVHMVEHITVVNLAAALLLLAVVVAYKTGAESELY